jgi:hypothetical protein
MSRYVYFLATFAVLIAAPAPSFADSQPLVIYPRLYNFPGQQLCQVDRSDSRYREFCSPQNYHPYGASGYRPFGTYRPYRAARRYWVAPDARVVPIDSSH